jgi:hypothetical protein
MVSSGSKPERKSNIFAGNFNEEANICLIMTWIDMNFRTADSIPPKKN